MPVQRQLIASEGDQRLERVAAAAHGRDWGVPHRAQEQRCILPGTGQVHCKQGGSTLFVDALTAFRLDAGEVYQLRHDGERAHLVLCNAGGTESVTGRAWLMDPRELFVLKRALRALRRGDLRVGDAAAIAARALARSHRLADAHPALLRARQALAERAVARLTMEELGEAAACSPFHLARLFRQQLGVAPHRYRLHLRLALGLQRLEQGERDLAGLAHDLGFASQSHFGDVMRQAVGCTPAAARAALAA